MSGTGPDPHTTDPGRTDPDRTDPDRTDSDRTDPDRTDPDRIYATDEEKLAVATAEALAGLEEGGIPIGAALFDADGRLLGRGRNQRVQGGNPALHGETSAFLNAGRQRSYRRTTMATTLSPCWYCSGLVRQFGIGRVIVGERHNFEGGQDWLVENGTEVTTLDDPELTRLMGDFIAANPELWNEDVGED